jgi:hypothetical protein
MRRNIVKRGNIKFLPGDQSPAGSPSGKAAVDSYLPFALSLARPSASSAVPPFADPLLPFSVTVALVSDDPLRFSTVTVFSSFVTLMSQVLSGLQQTQHRTEQLVHALNKSLCTRPNSDGREFDERWIVGCKLVISSRNTPTLLYFVEEPFDQVACKIQPGAKVFAISLRRYVRPGLFAVGQLPDPVRVISTIREQQRLWEQGASDANDPQRKSSAPALP